MNKYKLLSILLFVVAVILIITGVEFGIKSILRLVFVPYSKEHMSYELGYIIPCVLAVALAYWLWKSARQLWNKEV